jgi:hypothetical protein
MAITAPNPAENSLSSVAPAAAGWIRVAASERSSKKLRTKGDAVVVFGENGDLL